MRATDRQLHRNLPLFPLHKTVLFPQTTLPIHIMKPRYRAMAQRSLDRGGLIALATVDEDADTTVDGPAVHDIVGLGRIDDHEKVEDGRFLVFLKGLGRGCICEEVSVETPYRQAHIQQLPSQLPSAKRPRARDRVQSIRGALANLDQRGVDGASLLNFRAGQLSSPGTVADIVGASIFPKPRHRRWMLEQVKILRRLKAVDQRLGTLIAEAYDLNPVDRSELN